MIFSIIFLFLISIYLIIDGATGLLEIVNEVEILESDKVLMVDCDDTLVMWDLSNYPDEPRITLDCWGEVQLVVNHKNINTVRKFKKLGYKIVIWSATGYEWAVKVAQAVGLSDIADLYMSKPRYFVDDLSPNHFMGENVWRDIKSSEPEKELTNEDLDP